MKILQAISKFVMLLSTLRQTFPTDVSFGLLHEEDVHDFLIFVFDDNTEMTLRIVQAFPVCEKSYSNSQFAKLSGFGK